MAAIISAEPHPYHDLNDFYRMAELLVAGRQAQTSAYYVLPGDLSWWLFYLGQAHTPGSRAFLWEGADGRLDGWALLSLDWKAFDVFIRPELRASPQADDMYRWTEARAEAELRAQGQAELRIMWVAEDDDLLIDRLAQHGFSYGGYPQVILECSLTGAIPEPSLPPGFQCRSMAGEQDAPGRAAAQHAAFESSRPPDEYLQRYLGFMRSPVYTLEHDLAILAPDGRVAAFALIWPEPATRTGLFEPVGVHPDFQGRGLGKALMLSGLRRLQALGLQAATLCVDEDNTAAVGLYTACGFVRTRRLGLYKRALL